jgi:hypothetical protein
MPLPFVACAPKPALTAFGARGSDAAGPLLGIAPAGMIFTPLAES